MKGVVISVPSVLESVEWGKPALSLLSQCKQLDTNLPAVMHIRHTERPKPTQETRELVLKTGKIRGTLNRKRETGSILA